MALKQHDTLMLQKAENFLKFRAFEWPAVVSGPGLIYPSDTHWVNALQLFLPYEVGSFEIM